MRTKCALRRSTQEKVSGDEHPTGVVVLML
jgi:hypothetical protein